MCGHVDFRDHFYLARGGIFHNLDIIRAGEVAAAVVVRIWPGAELRQQAGFFAEIVTALRPYIGQFRQARYFNTPAFVIAQMKVEFIELIGRHLVKQAQHSGFSVEVASHIELNAAIIKTRRVLRIERGDLLRALSRDQ